MQFSNPPDNIPGLEPFRPARLAITVEKTGRRQYAKTSQPTRFGKYGEIRTRDYEFHFDLDGRIRFIRGLGSSWPHPFESLKRTAGNDWVYYTVGAVIEQRGIRDWLGEYYLPCFAYQSNAIVNFTPYAHPAVPGALAAWAQLYADIRMTPPEKFPARTRTFLSRVAAQDDTALLEQAQALHAITGGPVSVLPPDTRHVDYDVIPVTIADGCLYHCRFCIVKSGRTFRPRPLADIREQIRQLKALYGRNLSNYNALFLGNHDALAAGADRILPAAAEAYEAFGFANANIGDPRLFLFGSVDALRKARASLFADLARLPFHTCINIGLESVDPETLRDIGKPLEAARVREAFKNARELNRLYENLEVSVNFLIGRPLSERHHDALAELLAGADEAGRDKGAVYLSPLAGRPDPDSLLRTFFALKESSRLPAYIYLIQRL